MGPFFGPFSAEIRRPSTLRRGFRRQGGSVNTDVTRLARNPLIGWHRSQLRSVTTHCFLQPSGREITIRHSKTLIGAVLLHLKRHARREERLEVGDLLCLIMTAWQGLAKSINRRTAPGVQYSPIALFPERALRTAFYVHHLIAVLMRSWGFPFGICTHSWSVRRLGGTLKGLCLKTDIGMTSGKCRSRAECLLSVRPDIRSTSTAHLTCSAASRWAVSRLVRLVQAAIRHILLGEVNTSNRFPEAPSHPTLGIYAFSKHSTRACAAPSELGSPPSHSAGGSTLRSTTPPIRQNGARQPDPHASLMDPKRAVSAGAREPLWGLQLCMQYRAPSGAHHCRYRPAGAA